MGENDTPIISGRRRDGDGDAANLGITKHLNPMEQLIARVMEKEFEELSKGCTHRVVDSKGVCCTHPGSNSRNCVCWGCPRLQRKRKIK